MTERNGLWSVNNNEKDLAWIVINAFSEPYILDKELWNLFDKM